ncbi:hypothetical protein HYPSUDRAFT_206377 [Hypholoma sublateritium FD-334 SS-4]|uniref:Uncharacterized protein n=1 Tax=Hypholoma sublateritium (strain FD-334 SS-4) TaxID=945553 RepID=A0A0D2KRG6_HYPSF|nr:hypothetical protein HYPSUDRAFT_206377 [Hypholoma sublateritium FD-334 SS-4]
MITDRFRAGEKVRSVAPVLPSDALGLAGLCTHRNTVGGLTASRPTRVAAGSTHIYDAPPPSPRRQLLRVPTPQAHPVITKSISRIVQAEREHRARPRQAPLLPQNRRPSRRKVAERVARVGAQRGSPKPLLALVYPCGRVRPRDPRRRIADVSDTQ